MRSAASGNSGCLRVDVKRWAVVVLCFFPVWDVVLLAAVRPTATGSLRQFLYIFSFAQGGMMLLGVNMLQRLVETSSASGRPRPLVWGWAWLATELVVCVGSFLLVPWLVLAGRM